MRPARVVVGLGLLLVAQFLFVLFVEEPFPAVVMPAFRGAGSRDGVYPATRADVFVETDSGTTRLSMHEFLFDMPESYRYAVMNRLFSPKTGDQVRSDPAFREWIWKRCGQLTAGARADSLRVEWHADAYDTRATPPTRSSQYLGTFLVSRPRQRSPASDHPEGS